MASPKRVSKKFLEFLASWEGMELTAYKVPGENFYTIGVGHTGKVDGKKITRGMKISKTKAMELLKQDVASAEKVVLDQVPERWREDRRMFETMVSLTFNMGPEILTVDPPLTSFAQIVQRKKPTRRNQRQAAAMILLYNKGGQPLRVMPGLVRRRQAERKLFLHGEYVNND